MASTRAALQDLRLDSILHGAGCRRDTNCNCLRHDLLGGLVLCNGPSYGEFSLRIRLLDDDAVFPVPGKLGSVDHRFRSIIHSHLERAAVLLRHVRAFQWRKYLESKISMVYTLTGHSRSSVRTHHCLSSGDIGCTTSIARLSSPLSSLNYANHISAATYWIAGILAATLTGIPVECTPSEAGHFNPPPGQTCQEYAGQFAQASPGYLLNPMARTDCQYCPYSVGDQYLSTLNIQADEKWRDFGIFLVFVCTNWMLVYFFIYSVRIRGWSFGFGYIFGVLGKGVELVKKPFKGLLSKKEE